MDARTRRDTLRIVSAAQTTSGASKPSAQGFAFLRNLGWLAICDGPLRRAEAAALARIAEASEGLRGCLAPTLALLEEMDYATVADACRGVGELAFNDRRRLLRCAVQVALADGGLTVAEGHALRLMADLCCGGVGGEQELANAYREVTNRALPALADPSSVEWWRNQELTGKGGADDEDPHAASARRRLENLNLLGLEPNASPPEVEARFRDLMKMLHPDRFHHDPRLGSVAAALFQRIQTARRELMEP